MSSPSLNRCSLPCGRLPSWSLRVILLTLTLHLYFQASASQPLEIRKTIKEELLPGSPIANLASEPDFLRIVGTSSGSISKDSSTSSKLQYSILTSANPHSQFFAVDKTSGVISINRNIDREDVCSFRDECILTFEVAAQSVYGVFFLLVDFVIEVTDINDNPPEFTQSQFDLNIPENSETGRSFQLPTAFDRDTGVGNGVSEYRILKGPPMFDLNSVDAGFNTTDVYLTLVSSISWENDLSYKVLVGAVDGGVPQLTGTLTVEVQVSDINDNFPVFEKYLYVVNVPEDTRNDQVILQVKATDADSGPNGRLTYAFSAQQPQDDLDYFRVEANTGEIFLTRSIESRTGDEIELLVEASDQGHPPKVSRARVRILVEDTINSMPDIIIDTLGGERGVAEVSEYAEIGKVVAHVSVRDPDSGENGRTNCSLSNPEFNLVKLDDDGKYKAVLMAGLNREIIDMYNLTVSCSDHGFPSLLARRGFAVRVLDENDQTPVFSQRLYEASVYENISIGALIVQLTVTDGDIGKNAEVWFDVVGINKQYFTIDDTGKMMPKTELDRETSERIVTTVVVTDRGDPPLSSSATVVVNLLDINDMAPQFSQMIYKFEVEEERSAGTYVGIVSASDKDAGDNKKIFYRILDTEKDGMFQIGTDGGVIKTNAKLDREKQERYGLTVLATDRGNPPLTGTASVIIQVVDTNDNEPYFLYPVPSNNSISIPHSFDPEKPIVSILAHDADTGLNAKIVYSVSSVNDSTLFVINANSGGLFLKESLSKDDVGSYILTLMANDRGPKHQHSTQAPLYIDIFFDNSTLLGAPSSAGPSKGVITAIIIVGVVLLIALVAVVTIVCIIKRRRLQKKSNGGMPNSASSSSTAKLQGGYYIAPGVRGSSSSFLAKQEDSTCNNNVNHDMGDGVRTTNPYVVMLPRTEAEAPTEIIEISRNGQPHGLNDTLNTLDLDQTDDGQFSTFKSQEDILSPGLRQGSLRRQDQDNSSIAKRANDTFDDLSNDDSTSDSGRGGSDVDVNNGAAAAAKLDKARAQAATPISVKSGISHRLSPLPRDSERTFVTFRGDSPSSFRFDSDSDTLPRTGPRSRVGSSMPMMSSPTRRDAPRFDPMTPRAGPSQLSESDTDSELTPRYRYPAQPPNIAGIYSPNTSANGYNSGGEGSSFRQPLRVTPLPMFMPPSAYHRPESETDQSDGGSNPSSSLTRRNHVPRLPVYPGIEFTHHAYGAPNRNSIGAFSNTSTSASNSDGVYQDNERSGYYPNPSANGVDYNSLSNDHHSSGFYDQSHNPWAAMPDSRITSSYGNVVSELQESRPVSMEEDFLLPPYPEVDEDEESNLNIHSGYTGFSPERDAERAALFSRSRFESSA